MLRIITLLFFCLICPQHINATEIDNVTHRNVQLKNARLKINRIVAAYFEEAIAVANTQHSCDPWIFLNPLAKRVGKGFYAEIEKEVAKDPSVDKVLTTRRESIYQDFSFFDAPGIFFTGFGHLIRIDDTVIGIDKLGHFLSTGYSYFKRMYNEGKSYEQILRFGERSERTYFGLAFTGIFSYADLSANIDGFHFWERLVGFGDQNFHEPYVRCEQGRWSINSAFDISDYVNAAWDEGTNCSRFRNKRMQRKVAHRLSELEKARDERYMCPIAAGQCATMIARYGDAAHSVISPKCFASIARN